jgi:hypothetical protein
MNKEKTNKMLRGQSSKETKSNFEHDVTLDKGNR